MAMMETDSHRSSQTKRSLSLSMKWSTSGLAFAESLHSDHGNHQVTSMKHRERWRERAVAQSGSASDWGSEGRRFESGQPDQFGVWRSLAARVLWEHEAAGSIPATPTKDEDHDHVGRQAAERAESSVR